MLARPAPAARAVHVRMLVAVLVAAVVAVGLTGCSLGGGEGSIADVEAFQPLPVPPLAPSRLDDDGRRVFDLDVRETSTDFGAGPVPGTWGANGDYLAPTIRAERGDTVVVNVTNGTPEMTTLHWHGMHVPARMDGGPHSMVPPGTTWSPTWTIDQPAATLWFHPHPHGQTAEQIYRGLAGLFIIDDPAADPGGLPDEYGVDDIPLVVQDKSFTPSGELDFEAGETTAVGFVGDTVVVNGALGAYLEADHERIRLRLLNASTARIYRFAMADDRPFSVIASDGGLLAEPVTTTSVQLSPAERAEIVVDLRPGETTALVSHTPDLGARVDAARIFGGATFDVLQIRAGDDLEPAPDLPTTTAELPAVDRASAAGSRAFVMGGRIINGRLMDMGRIDEVVTVDTPEIWSVTNQSSLPHNFHVHDGQFRVLSMDGSPPPAELAGWKDTVYVAPTTTVEVLVRFETYTDPGFPYMYHCHLTVHEDQGMMGQFVVVEPGTDPSQVSAPADAMHSGAGTHTAPTPAAG
ncbi:MAG: multicopper oxidase domain-containing protein [Jiangellales bacterium]